MQKGDFHRKIPFLQPFWGYVGKTRRLKVVFAVKQAKKDGFIPKTGKPEECAPGFSLSFTI
jgi:hypothetical protein